jgi:microfibrillar-associated protein 1
MSVTAGVRDTVMAVRDKLRGKIGQTKVKRYWPGKAPEWADDVDEDGDIRMNKTASLEKAFPSHQEDSNIVRKDDRRLRRLAESRVDNRDEIRADHRRIRQAEIVSTIEEENRRQEGLDLEEEDEEAQEEKRRRIRERILLQQKQEAAILEEEDDIEEEEEEVEESSEYETDSDDEQPGIVMAKPVFVPRSERDTISERERIEQEDVQIEELMKKRLAERKAETKKIVVEEINKEKIIQKNLESEANVADVDTDDEMNEAEEYEAWKAREIARIKRDREDRDAMAKQREETEKFRNMTEEEKREFERKNPKPSSTIKKKWTFMQKYFHKGAYFQGEDDGIYQRDFSAPTGEDKMDKTILPKVMQVKHFGRSGRTKWTHLVNEDTTDWDNPWTYNDPLRAKYDAKMAGMNAPIAKPKGSKKLKDWETR